MFPTDAARVQECQPHCLQILSARLLLYLSHRSSYRASLVEETQLRLLVSSLDTTHDPVSSKLKHTYRSYLQTYLRQQRLQQE